MLPPNSVFKSLLFIRYVEGNPLIWLIAVLTAAVIAGVTGEVTVPPPTVGLKVGGSPVLYATLPVTVPGPSV